jgi:hypothetical protein
MGQLSVSCRGLQLWKGPVDDSESALDEQRWNEVRDCRSGDQAQESRRRSAHCRFVHVCVLLQEVRLDSVVMTGL